MRGYGLGIYKRVKLSLDVLPYPAYADLLVCKDAVVGAKMALDYLFFLILDIPVLCELHML